MSSIDSPLGQTSAAGAVSVVVASDQTPVPVVAGATPVSVAFGDSSSLDAFSRVRVSLPVPLSEVSFEYNLNPLILEQIVTGSATITHNGNTRTADLALSTGADTVGVGTVTITGASNPRTATFTNSQTLATSGVIQVGDFIYQVITGATGTVFSVNGESTQGAGSAFTIWGSHAILRQKQRNLYKKGKSQLSKDTFLILPPIAGTTVQAGYYSQFNGFFLRQATSATGVVTLTIVRRSFVTGTIVETSIPQSSWNVDTLSGSGDSKNPSGIALDMTKQQISVMDAQWLGAGRVRVYFDIDGVLILVHQFLHANRSAIAPYIQTYTLPITYEAFNNAASAGGLVIKAICMEVESEDAMDPSPPQRYHFTSPAGAQADVAVTTTRTHLLSIRPKQTFAGRTNRIIMVPDFLSILIGVNSILCEVIYNCTLTTVSPWVSVDSESGMEYNYGVGATISAVGTVISSFYLGGANRDAFPSNIGDTFPLVLDSFGANPLPISLVLTSITGTSQCRGTIDHHEYR